MLDTVHPVWSVRVNTALYSEKKCFTTIINYNDDGVLVDFQNVQHIRLHVVNPVNYCDNFSKGKPFEGEKMCKPPRISPSWYQNKSYNIIVFFDFMNE